ncbi:hypothetical protein B5M09_013536 [Aphanomyces astaci]|uniref:Uncharacterized protein n=1 Tax=Aphanomyces astaci TaxID=112090 RepID=A0A425DP15_APHAT|nr:hypothetical protein B5M09_013536 [Aphanomyces astaci]
MASNIGGASSASPDEVLMIVDKILARRQFFREKQRKYCGKKNADSAAMKAELVQLESVLDDIQATRPVSVAPREASDGPLSWHSIAIVFKREAHRVLTDRQSLVTQTQEYHSLMHAMQCFVVMNIPVVEECTGNTRLLHTTTSKGIFVNSLQGHFIEADRFIMVMRQVEHDEVHVCHPQHKQRHLRTEVRQVSPSHISVRVVSHASHLFRPATGFLSVDELAALRGIDVTDVDDGLKDEYVRRQLIQREYAEFLPWRQRLIDLMHRHRTKN